MKVVTEILQDLEILKRLLKHNANLKIRINYYLTRVQRTYCMGALCTDVLCTFFVIRVHGVKEIYISNILPWLVRMIFTATVCWLVSPRYTVLTAFLAHFFVIGLRLSSVAIVVVRSSVNN